MKVSQERLRQPYYPHNAAQNLQDESHGTPPRAPHEEPLDGPLEEPLQSPLEAKRRVQPGLASAEPEEQYYSDEQPYAAHAEQQEEAQYAARSPETQRQYRDAANKQGPYQAVVVFLLLLMALVILGIVYQLFFRPSPDYLPIVGQQTNQQAEQLKQTEQQNQTDQQLLGLQSQEELSTEQQDKPLQNKPSQAENSSTKNLEQQALSSPLSSVTPSGEIIQSTNKQISKQQSAPPAPRIPQQAQQSKVGGIGYWIQVGAFSSFANANNIRGQLEQHHIESVIQETGGTRKFYRVRVGLYTSKEEAERILRQVHNIGSPFNSSMIIRIDI